MTDAVILSACRTPIGSFGGALKDLSAAERSNRRAAGAENDGIGHRVIVARRSIVATAPIDPQEISSSGDFFVNFS